METSLVLVNITLLVVFILNDDTVSNSNYNNDDQNVGNVLDKTRIYFDQ